MKNYAGRISAVLFVLLLLVGVGVWVGGDDGPGGSTGGWRTRIARLFGFSGTNSGNGPGRSGDRNKFRLKSGEVLETPTVADGQTSAAIEGLITDQQKKPVGAAKITVRSADTGFNKSFNSNDKGRFLADQIPPGTYDILAAHPKFVTLIRPSFNLAPNQKVQLNFQLPLGVALKGNVADEEGQPIVDARLSARKRTMEQVAQGGGIFLDDATYKTQQSQKDGAFALEGIAVGDNLMEVSKAGYEPQSLKVVVSPDKATEPMKIVLKRTGVIAGTVLDEDKKPVAKVNLALTRYKPFGGEPEKLAKEKFTVTSDEAGKFKFSKLFNDGFYDVVAESDAFAPSFYPLVASGTDKLTCVMTSGGSIEGTTVYIDRESTAASVLLTAEAIIAETTVTREVKSTGDGVYKFAKLPFGKYKLFVNSDVLMSEPKNDVNVAKGTATKNVTVEVFEAAHVNGRVTSAEDDAVIAGATISLKAQYGPGQSKYKVFEAKSNEHGDFDFPRLPAGLHSAQAWANGFVRTSSGSSAQTFSLQPGEKKGDVALRLDRGGMVEGFVIDPRGRSVEGCDIQLFVANTTPRKLNVGNLKAKTDASGYFKIWGMEIGERLQLYASASIQGRAKTRSPIIDLTASKPTAATQIVLNAGNTIYGKITDPNKLPIPNAEVVFSSDEFDGDPSSSSTRVYSQPDGSFSIPACAPGRGNVKVFRSGFVEQRRYVWLNPKSDSRNENFQLDPGYVISGRVISLDNKPVPNARVEAFPLDGAPGRDDTVTNKNGEYTLNNLGKGRFRLETTFKVPTSEGEQQYKFQVASVRSATTGLDIDCDLIANTSGIVEDDAEKRVNGFRFILKSKTDTKPSQDFVFNVDRRVNATGGLLRVLRVPRGVYSLEVAADGYESYYNESLVIGPGTKNNLPKIKLRPAGGLTGTVLSSVNKRPVNDCTVKVYELPDADVSKKRLVAQGRTDYTGQFRISSAPSGVYQTEFEHPSYESLTLAQVNIFRKKYTDLGKLTMEAGGTIQGTVVDEYGVPVPGINITVSGLLPAKKTVTDQAGNYLLQGVRAGQWPVVARGRLRNRAVYRFQDTMVMAQESQNADFELDTAADLDGIVASADGGAIHSGTVRVHPFDENSNVIEDIHYDTNVLGQRFNLASIPAGPVFLWATGLGVLGNYSSWQSLVLGRGKNNANVSLQAGGIGGNVKSVAGGTPAGGVSLQLFPVISNYKLPQSIYNSLVRRVYTNPDGRFDFNYLQAGTYQLLYQDPNAQWIAQPPVNLAPNQRVPEYNINLGQ
ncbi:MAG: carboxypeptidase-like regulatory domain-containing protein [Candidatus Sumerlaeaceae bacterium]|nr:carboxypeptidase-like regulatory domain-containing protein [Candidatus Sumerlaeaceae bacterium]